MNKDELVIYLEGKEEQYKELVKRRENILKNTEKESFYYLSHLKNIHKLNAKRELIKEILEKMEEN